MTIYINGIRASAADLARLKKEVREGRETVTVRITAAGSIAIRTV